MVPAEALAPGLLRRLGRSTQATGGSRLNAVAQRVADAFDHSGRTAVCFPCLATEAGLREHDVRAAALVLIARTGLDLARGVCSCCQRECEVLAARKAA
jgi:hypothetical protein